MLKSVFRDPDNVSNNSTYISNSVLRTLDIYKINLKLQHICQIILPDNVYCKIYDFITQNHQNLAPSDIICVGKKKMGRQTERECERECRNLPLALSHRLWRRKYDSSITVCFSLCA